MNVAAAAVNGRVLLSEGRYEGLVPRSTLMLFKYDRRPVFAASIDGPIPDTIPGSPRITAFRKGRRDAREIRLSRGIDQAVFDWGCSLSMA
jgi:hypothetical protein